MRFNFTGKLSFNGEKTKNPWYRQGKTKSGNDYHTFNCAVVADENNREYTELFGMIQDVIKTTNLNGDKIEIDWNDRDDKDSISEVSSMRKYKANIDNNRVEAITPYDFVEYLKNNKDAMTKGRFTVSGNVTKNIYNGTVSNKFQIQNVYQVEEEAKSKLTIDGEIFYRTEDIDVSDWTSEKKIYFNAFTKEYVDGSNKYVPQQFVFDASKVNPDNEKHIKQLIFKLKQLGIDYNLKTEKVSLNLKKNKVYHIPVKCTYINGAEEVEFDVNQLTANQKEAIELGFKTIDDFKPKGRIFGQKIQIFKITDFDLRDEFADGVTSIDETMDEFEENILVVMKEEEKVEDVIKEENLFPEDDDDESPFD